MAEKLLEYQGLLGWLHGVRDRIKEKWFNNESGNVKTTLLNLIGLSNERQDDSIENYSHVYRRKTRKELVRVSAAVMGIEFSYAAETAFVSPTLLKIGVEHKRMTLVWALSPLVGFFLTPILGSVSDRCQSQLGRRRPFIILMSLGVLIGLILVPNGEYFGYSLGDVSASNFSQANISTSLNEYREMKENHSWGIFLTVLGTVLLDFDADACQSPSRAYLLDVTLADDHARGLSTFTTMAGLGGFFGYALGGINWDVTFIGALFGGHVRAVFTLITIIFIICVTYTITSFKEIPLYILENSETIQFSTNNDDNKLDEITNSEENNYGAIEPSQESISITDQNCASNLEEINPNVNASLHLYLRSIVFMPASLRILCLTNLFCWMAHVCYSLYFTDFVGEAVFQGSPIAPEGTVARQLYEEGIRFGCWGMSMYSLSCACYSFVIEKLINRFGARSVYVGGLLIYSTGMMLMALTKHQVGVILFSWTAGIMYSTLFTMPYLLVAHYHAKGTFDGCQTKSTSQVRGLGTDVALVSSMVFLAQFILSLCMGSIVTKTGTTTAVVAVASILAFFGAISATQVLYLDL